jgi:exodeoxyribonuclease V gamma subunit
MLQAWSAYRDVDPPGRPLGPDRAWQAELWRRLRARWTHPEPPTGWPPPLRACGIDRAWPTCRPGCRCSGPPGWSPTRWRCWRRWPSPARCTSGFPPRPPACGRRWPTTWTGAAGRPVLAGSTTTPRPWAPIDCWPTWAGTPGSCSSRWRPPGSTWSTSIWPRRTALRPTASSGGCRPTSRPTVVRGPSRSARSWTGPDRSIVLHAAHGPDRQVEVLREVLVGLLADDPTLEPRDIVVMCPDIEAFAPLIAAAFGLDTAEAEAEHPGHRLRVRLADRSLRPAQPVAGRDQPTGAAGRRPDAGLGDPRPLRHGTGGPQVLLHRRRAGPAPGPHRPGGCPLGPRRRASGPLRAGRLRAEHLGRRAGPAAARAWPWTRASSASWARPCRWTTWTPPTST